MRSLILAPVFIIACTLFVPGAFADDKKDVKKLEVDPKSNNKDKIFGKWKVLSIPGQEEVGKQLEAAMISMFFEFEKDGTFALSFESPNQLVIDALKKQFKTTRFTARYKLLQADGIELYDFADGPLKDAFKNMGTGKSAKSDITIKSAKEGDVMTMKDPDGKTGKLVRAKDEKKDK